MSTPITLGRCLPLDWVEWRAAFDLDSDALWQATRIFPALAASRRPGDPPLTAELLLALVADEEPPDAQQAFDDYLLAGELAAAGLLLPRAAALDSAERLRQRLAERRAALELELNREQSAFEAAHRRLVILGERAEQDPWRDEQLQHVAAMSDAGRLGAALAELRDRTALLQKVIEACRIRLDGEIETVCNAAATLDPVVQTGVERQLQRAARYRASGAEELGRHAVRLAQVMVETHSATLPDSAAEAPEQLPLRWDFPDQVQARHIYAWLVRGEQPAISGVEWETFRRAWLPADWKQGRPPESQVYQVIHRLAEAASSTPSANNRTWLDFLKDLFDLLGRRGQQPATFSELGQPRRLKSGARVGFWLGYCAPTLALRGTFLDPSRIGDEGLPVLIWHRPNEPLCPKPTSLELYLDSKRLRDRPLLVLADQPVDPEVRRALHTSVPGAALLDETDLLRIVLSSTDLASDQNADIVRQIHFSALVSSQLPPSRASPFVEQGSTPDAMFFGRREVLREMRDPSGPRILYGGRRLGKSSILQEIRRRFVREDPKRNIGIYMDCATEGMTDESVLRLVQGIAARIDQYTPSADGLGLGMQFAGRFPRPSSVSEFLEQLSALLREFPDHRFLLLLDETDTLCEYLDVPPTRDLTDAKGLGWGLRRMVSEFGDRFDIRFAGFQEIQRSAASTTGPFYNFGLGRASLPLKVFTPEEATEFLATTLQQLAVQFSDIAMVDRILGFTGRHPALLQEFGRQLYLLIRERRSRPPWSVRPEDIDAVMLNREFRKRVVDTIHLNVSRDTRSQQILRLLLYLWVQQIMAPPDGTAPHEAHTARDLFDLMGQVLGTDAQRHLDVASIESYLSDLEVLGVLERRDQAYIFAYRAFATLLYHDHFAGGLGRQTLEDTWSRIEKAPTARRLWITTETGHSLSPLSHEEHERLVEENRRPILLLGPTGSGLTTLARWLAHQVPARYSKATARYTQVRLESCTATGLREGLAGSLGCAPGRDWQEFYDVARQRAESLSRTSEIHTLVVDPVDPLTEADDEPLFFWDEAAQIAQHENVFGLLGSIAEASRGHLRFLFTGSLPTARLWVENSQAFASTISRYQVQRLDAEGCSAWLEAARIIVPNDQARARVWDGTAGDWRLLDALNSWLHGARQDGEAVTSQAELERFFTLAFDPDQRACALPNLECRLADPKLESLRMVAQVADEWKIPRWSLSDLRDACHDHAQDRDGATALWSPGRWEIELRALAQLHEIEDEIVLGSGPRDAAIWFTVRSDDPWLALLRP
jgi:hypothetical protein